MSVTINASTSSGLVQSADTSGQIDLQSNGTTKLSVLSTGVSGTLIQGTAVASTSGTSIDFTGIPSWVKRITVVFQGISGSGTSPQIVQLGTGGTPTYTTSGYVGAASYVGSTNSAGGVSITAGIPMSATPAAADARSGALTLVNLSGNSWVGYLTAGQTTSAYAIVGGGSITLGATLTAVRITTVNGTDTFDAGTINIQYEG